VVGVAEALNPNGVIPTSTDALAVLLHPFAPKPVTV
jgi:hypothetical protein